MKKFLLLFFLPSVFAASPSFNTFNTNDFIVVDPTSISLRNPPGPGFWVLNGSSLEPNAGNSLLVTNLNSAETLTASGAFITTAFGVNFIAPGTNTINPFQKSMFFLASIATNGVIVNFDQGNGPGQRITLINVFTNSTFVLPSGPLADDTNLFVTVRSGAWAPTEPGESIELVGVPGGWIEINRAVPTGGVPTTNGPIPGTMINTGASTQYIVPTYTGTDGTNLHPSMVSFSGDTNGIFPGYLQVGGGNGDSVFTNRVQFITGITLSNAAPLSFLGTDGNQRVTNIVSISDLVLWTNNSGVLQPTDLTLQNMVNNGWYIGTNSPGFYGPLAGDSLVTFHNTALGDPNYANIQQIVSDSAGTSGNYSLFTVNQDTGYAAFRMDTAIGSTNTARFALGSTTAGGTNRAQLELFLPARGDPSLIMTRLDPEGFFGGVPYLFDTPSTASTNLAQFANNGTNQFTIAAITGIGAADGSKFFANDGTFHSSSGAGTTINATDTYLPARLNSTTFTNSPLYTVNGTNWGFDQLMYLGPTNIVGRRNSDLTYTNLNAQAFGLKIGHSVGGEAHFLASSSGTLITSGNANFPVTLEAGGGTPIIVNPANFYPNGTMQLGLNGSPGAWTNLWMTGVLNVQGTNDGSGHFNRLALYNDGTNNIIDSQASATGAGLPLAQSYRIGGTNIFTLDATSGASTTGLLIYENGTAQRVSIWTNDSAGLGFRGLRVPN